MWVFIAPQVACGHSGSCNGGLMAATWPLLCLTAPGTAGLELKLDARGC